MSLGTLQRVDGEPLEFDASGIITPGQPLKQDTGRIAALIESVQNHPYRTAAVVAATVAGSGAVATGAVTVPSIAMPSALKALAASISKAISGIFGILGFSSLPTSPAIAGYLPAPEAATYAIRSGVAMLPAPEGVAELLAQASRPIIG